MRLGRMQMASALLRRSVRFISDPVGFERTIRLLQAILQIGSHYSFAFVVIQSVCDSTAFTSQAADATRSAIQSLHANCALSRRLFRLIRLIDSLNGVANPCSAPEPSAPEPPARSLAIAGTSWSWMESWLDVAGEAFNNMYLLFEAVTTVDGLQAQDSHFLTVELERFLSLESSRFWLFSLICGAMSGLLQILSVLLHTPDQLREKMIANDSKRSTSSQEEITGLTPARQKAPTSRNIWPDLQVAGRRCLANTLDIAQPGVTVGWITADRGVLGVVMLVTTILTAMDVWDRCGEEQQGKGPQESCEAHAKMD